MCSGPSLASRITSSITASKPRRSSRLRQPSRTGPASWTSRSLREGSLDEPFGYELEESQTGRAFAARRLTAALEITEFAQPDFTVYANTTAQPIEDPVRQLGEQLVRPVQFAATLERMAAEGKCDLADFRIINEQEVDFPIGESEVARTSYDGTGGVDNRLGPLLASIGTIVPGLDPNAIDGADTIPRIELDR